MTIDLNRLKTMEKSELIDLARQLNSPFHPNNSTETLIENIINKVMQQTLNHPDKEQVKPDAPVEPIFLTEQELEEAFASIKDRSKAFSTVYDHEAKCVTMRYNDGRYRHSETMSLSCSKTKFIRKAAEIARGPLVPRAVEGDWDRLGGSNPNNNYAGTVLAG